jgi:cyclopropane-fatty-acyl-phospholipid synthase
MNAQEDIKGRQSGEQGYSLSPDGDLFLRLKTWIIAATFGKILARIDSGLVAGMIDGRLPSGEVCILGGHSPGPVAQVNLRKWRALWRVARRGTVGLYEAWEKGEWDSPDPVPLFDLFVRNRNSLGKTARPSGASRIAGLVSHWMRRNTKQGARRNIEFHYDLGNDFYAAWLDQTMTYSSAIFAEPITLDETLETAQIQKNISLLDRLNLRDGDSVLEMGCGWGGLAQVMLERHSVDYHGITLSLEQKAYADERLGVFGKRAQISITDYRDVPTQYDAIASVEMVEAVGQSYWPDYLDAITRALKPGGRAAIQYIRIEDDVFGHYAKGTDFIQHYIFPGGMLLSQSRFQKLAQERGLEWLDQSDFGPHYAETLWRWRVGFDEAVAQNRLPSVFDKKFIRLWRFYLMYCEGGFRGGGINVSQVTLVKK